MIGALDVLAGPQLIGIDGFAIYPLDKNAAGFEVTSALARKEQSPRAIDLDIHRNLALTRRHLSVVSQAENKVRVLSVKDDQRLCGVRWKIQELVRLLGE